MAIYFWKRRDGVEGDNRRSASTASLAASEASSEALPSSAHRHDRECHIAGTACLFRAPHCYRLTGKWEVTRFWGNFGVKEEWPTIHSERETVTQ
jgi:hypothetical protein